VVFDAGPRRTNTVGCRGGGWAFSDGMIVVVEDMMRA
jgi:hypothetical protein